jgi:hypothetical protein
MPDLNIDTRKAEALPGVMAVTSNKDFPLKPFGTRPDTRTGCARDKSPSFW